MAGMAAACAECGCAELVRDGGDEYCSECGAVAESVLLTADYSHAAEGEMHRNYVPRQARADRAAPGEARARKRWNAEMAAEARAAVDGVCAAVGQPGLAERARRILDGRVRALMAAGARVVFGAWTAVRACACVYVAAREAGRALTLVDVARASRISVFAVGREAKRTLAALALDLPAPDPLLRAEAAANRLFGAAHAAAASPARRAELAAALAAGAPRAAQRFPDELLALLAAHTELRPRLAEATAALLAFDRGCARDTGVNPNTLVCAALALGVEHLYAASEHTPARALRPGQRGVVLRLAALGTGAGVRTAAAHADGTRRALVRAAAAVPWLAAARVTRDSVAAHALDIAFCHAQAQAWLFSLPPAARPAEAPRHAASLPSAPAFARAERLRARRAKMLDAPPAAAAASGDEAAVVARLHRLGVGRDALLALPLPALQQLLPAAERSHRLTDAARARLDRPVLCAEDMSDAELAEYIDSGTNDIHR
ncbi:hypothetical protein H4R18_004187 [Coemansia javaensis]|uniref:Transcription initiation factor IIB n=1 Tax=Coemansia javaensis TaxID=2761396 RepID=A0A9W8H4Y1_9FUNG|nr:hypothetical protein H4R18_004187 [Coemansia javaensis]